SIPTKLDHHLQGSVFEHSDLVGGIRNPADRQREYSSLSADMVYPSPQASRDIASLAIWSSHKVAASFGSQPCSNGTCIGGLMTGAIWNAVNGECRLMAHLYGPAVRCKPDMTDQEIIGLAHLYSAL